MKKEYEERAKALVHSLDGPLGRRKLQAVMGEHQALLQDLRDQGASWPQIASLLTRAGLRREDGKIVSPAQLRAMFSRVVGPVEENGAEQGCRNIRVGEHVSQSSSGGVKTAQNAAPSAVVEPKLKHQTNSSSLPETGEQVPQNSKSLRERMRRASAARKL